MDLAALTAELAARIETADSRLHVTNFRPDSPVIPAVYIQLLAPLVYHDAYGGSESPRLLVGFLLGSVASQASQMDLYGWLSTGTTNSVIDAIETQQGSTDVSMRVAEMTAIGTVELQDGGTRYYSVELNVEVLA